MYSFFVITFTTINDFSGCIIMTTKILYSVYDEDSSFDISSTHYGPAITTSFKENDKIFVTNGEYISQVNYCPYTGEKANAQI